MREKKMKSVRPSLRKSRKSVFMVSKKSSNYHNALRSLPRPPVGGGCTASAVQNGPITVLYVPRDMSASFCSCFFKRKNAQ